jgi:hypothetical protein
MQTLRRRSDTQARRWGAILAGGGDKKDEELLTDSRLRNKEISDRAERKRLL